MTPADEIARRMELVAHDAERIQALSHTQPHVFAEQKDDVARRMKALASEVRNTFGGTPAQLGVGPGRSSSGRRVRVETRQRAG